MTESRFRFRAFISYSHADEEWAHRLHRYLEGYRVPRRLVGCETDTGPVPPRLTPVFRDREELATSPDLGERISTALADSRYLVLICSRAAAESEWVNREVALFKTHRGGGRVICVIVDGDPSSEIPGERCFPPAIRQRFDEQGNIAGRDAEPVGADLRPGGDGRSLAFLKVVAGLLDVGLEDLRQRHVQRQQRRMTAISLASLAGFLVMAGLTFDALQARREADSRRLQAEELLGFMVGDLRRSLEPIGRLDLLRPVGDQAMAYFDRVEVDQLSGRELLEQIRIMTQVGEVRIAERHYEQALDSFDGAYRRAVALLESQPGNLESLFNRGQAEFWIGFVHWRAGSLEAARDWLARYRDTGLELESKDPTDWRWQREVGYGHHNLAVLHQEMGNLSAAQASFEAELVILERLEPEGDPAVKQDLADASSWLGNLAVLACRMPDAISWYERSRMLLGALSDADPVDARIRVDLAWSLRRLAEAQMFAASLDEAEVNQQEARRLFGALTASDVENAQWQRGLAGLLVEQGLLQLALGRDASARLSTVEALEILDRLESEGDAVYLRQDLANAHWLHANQLWAVGERRLAVTAAEKAAAYLELLEAEQRLNDRMAGQLAMVHLFLEKVTAQLQKTQVPLEGRAFELLRPRVADTSSPWLLHPWAMLLASAGRADESAAILDRLNAGGFRPLNLPLYQF